MKIKLKFYLAISLFLTIFSMPSFALSKSNIVHGTGFVYAVIDGDTFSVNVDDPKVYKQLKFGAKNSQLQYFNDKYRTVRIRLANIDTAESKHYDSSRNTQFGVDTAAYVKRKLEKQNIKFSCWGFGKYGRLICSISLGDKDLGLHLIKMGYSKYITWFGNHPFLHNEYEKAEK